MNKWFHAYMGAAERFADLSTARRLKVGAIIIKDQRVISIGYNGMPPGMGSNCEHECKSPGGEIRSLETKEEVIHAEQWAISKLAGSNESGRGADLVITHAPCVQCAKLTYATGIKRVIYKADYKSDAGIKFLNSCKIEVYQI